MITYYESGIDVTVMHEIQTLPLRVSEFSKKARHVNNKKVDTGPKCYNTWLNGVL